MQVLHFDEVVVPSSQCWNCKWLNENELRCPAFGNAPIPEEIQLNLHDHQLAYEGDSGVRFKAR
ncbi:MAG: hypothetical protein ACXV3U_06640 [Halobacteriota archaeon]